MKYSIPLLVFVFLQLTGAEISKDLAHFEYDRSALLNVKELSIQDRGGVTVHDITYASPRGGLVPAYLVVPNGKGKFAGIVWGHWMMPNSPTANRSEFLAEAIALAPGGVVSILIDTPYVRPGFKEDPDPFSSQGPDVVAQQVVDLRRAADLLLARDDVDPKRIGYVGHSFDANCGAILDAVDKRFTTFVFMGLSTIDPGFRSELDIAKHGGVSEISANRHTYQLSRHARVGRSRCVRRPSWSSSGIVSVRDARSIRRSVRRQTLFRDECRPERNQVLRL